eukprot:1996059-Rhodomonas_salina.2
MVEHVNQTLLNLWWGAPTLPTPELTDEAMGESSQTGEQTLPKLDGPFQDQLRNQKKPMKVFFLLDTDRPIIHLPVLSLSRASLFVVTRHRAVCAEGEGGRLTDRDRECNKSSRRRRPGRGQTCTGSLAFGVSGACNHEHDAGGLSEG